MCRAKLRCAHDTDLDPGPRQTIVERARAALGIRPLAVDHEPNRHSLRRFRNQSVRKGVADDARPEPELNDVDRRVGGGDVVEHRRVEVAPLDTDVDRARAALAERERERAASHGAARETLGMLADPVVLHGDPRSRRHLDLRGRGCGNGVGVSALHAARAFAR